jgi:DNA invertase Pin-like site-specific DNA recombinase
MTKTIAITYARVSTGRQAELGASLAEQNRATVEIVTRKGWELGRQYVDAGKSGTTITGRPELKQALAELKAGNANALIVSHLSRLARSTVDLCQIMQTARRQNWQLVILDLGVDTSTPAGELLASVVGTVAQYESRIIGERARVGHQALKAKGNRAGQKPLLPEPLRLEIATRVAQGERLSRIAESLNANRIATAKGGQWHASTVKHVANSVALDRELVRPLP